MDKKRPRITRRKALTIGASTAALLALLPGSALAQDVEDFTNFEDIPTDSAAPITELSADATTLSTYVSPKRQLRSTWIATVTNIDWPSKPGLSIETQKQEFISKVDELVKMHQNSVIVQIKPTADSFYPSNYGPWSQYITGVQGQDPGYDPLAFMLEESHKRNLEFHAWFNPYRVSMQGDPNKLSANHPARQHPDWLVSYGGKLYYNPGIPAAKDFIVAGIMEVVRNYDIDAVHMDDYFYPSPIANNPFPDDAQYQQYGAGFPDKAAWRRENVNQLIKEIAEGIKQIKSYVKFGISPAGVWRNKSTDPTGSDTQAGLQNYDDLHADIRHWIRQNWLDYVAPQIYWHIGYNLAAYDKLVDWWSKEVTGYNCHLYIGEADYKINANLPPWANPEELPNHFLFDLQYEQVKGNIHFSLKDVLRNPLGIKDRLINDIYRAQALIPVMPWMGGAAPRDVVLDHVETGAAGVSLRWVDRPHNNTTYYAIYRYSGNYRHDDPPIDEGQFLLTTVRKLTNAVQQTFVDTTAVAGQEYSYRITALDRLHNESTPSNVRTVTC
jgi:uncharacterized lipoprotein YddW (UPF0748 family)